MTTTTLHILNGDGTKGGFEQSGIQGHAAIWREILCEGPVASLNTSSFWEARKAFLASQYESSDNTYENKVLTEFEKIKQFQNYQEVVLWFEHDLFCQINLIGVLSWFSQQSIDQTTISIVSLGKHEQQADFYGIGQLYPEQFPELYESRKKLNAESIQFAAQVWEAYSNTNPTLLLDLIQADQFHQFPYLKKALSLHLLRFPHLTNGLNETEKRLLQLIQAKPNISTKELMGTILRGDNKWWGFGDLQYFNILDDLEQLIERQNGFVLNELGQQVLENKTSFWQFRKQEQTFGNAKSSEWNWNEAHQLVSRA